MPSMPHVYILIFVCIDMYNNFLTVFNLLITLRALFKRQENICLGSRQMIIILSTLSSNLEYWCGYNIRFWSTEVEKAHVHDLLQISYSRRL